MSAALVPTGCGGDNPRDVVRETATNLAKVRSASLAMRLSMQPTQNGGAGISISLRGPFALPPPGRLPTARLHYSQTAGERQTDATLISTSQAAFVSLEGQTYRLGDRQADALRSAGRPGRGSIGLSQLHVADWVENPRAGSSAPGEERVVGRLDVVAALQDVLAAQRRAGAAASRPAEADLRRLRQSVRSSSLELVTGRKDRLLRRLRAVAVLDVPARLRRKVAGAQSLRIAFDLRLESINRPVRVRAPARAPLLPGS